MNFFKAILLLLYINANLFAGTPNTSKTYWNGDIRIDILQNSIKSGQCCASVTVYKQDSLLYKVKFDSVESLGGTSGIFISENPIIKDVFVINKHGDYDGRTILVDNKGNIVNLPGGAYFTAGNNRYLFTEHLQDCCDEFTVYDLIAKKILYQSEVPFDYDNIRFYKNGDDVYIKFYYSDKLIELYKYNFIKQQAEVVNNIDRNTFIMNIKLMPDIDSKVNCSCN